MRGPEFVSVSVKDTKAWVDTVGPLYLSFDVYTDFSSYRSGVYRPASGPSNPLRGGHAVLLVGYDDALGAWLCKNSWGTNWGMNGFFWIAYGTSSVDTWSRMGLQGINPDPWTKRRLHNGNLYESGNGKTHRNLEVVALSGQQVQHRWRLGEAPWTWGKARAFGNDAASIPTLTGTTFNRNIEVVYATTGGRLHHWWTGGGGGAAWNDGGVFGPTGCKGMVGFTQGDYGAPGNFEVVAAIDGKLQHIWRSGGGWANGATFGARIGNAGASLLQSSYGGAHGNLEVVAARDDGTIQHFWRTSSDFVWHSGAVFGAGVSGPPVMVQGMYGMRDEAGPHGNFELCVCVGGQVQHWWRWNGGGDGQWRRSAVFGRDVRAVTGLCQSSWGGNLELVVTRTDGRSQHYFRNGSGWQDGGVFDGP